jgi:DNA polymerase elongation subunit (family B)
VLKQVPTEKILIQKQTTLSRKKHQLRILQIKEIVHILLQNIIPIIKITTQDPVRLPTEVNLQEVQIGEVLNQENKK